MEKEGMSHLVLRTKSFPGTLRLAGTWSGTRKSSSNPARQSRLTRPETSSVDSMAAKIRNNRLLPETIAPKATTRMAKVNSSPPRVIR
jgi:hypothetical protein